jgi:hypothetical protein
LDALATAGVSLTRAGDHLRYQTRPGVSISPYREQITTHKSALLTLLALQDEIVRTASAARDAFDRQHYDEIWSRWHARQEETS